MKPREGGSPHISALLFKILAINKKYSYNLLNILSLRENLTIQLSATFLEEIGMRKQFLLVLTAVFIISTAASSNTLTGATNIDQPELNILKSDNSSIIVDFEMPGVTVDKITKDSVEYDLITMEGRGTTGHIGAPELPIVTKLLAIPDRAGVRIKSVVPEFVTYQGINPVPHQEFDHDNPIGMENWVFDEAYYSEGVLFPDKWATLGDPAIMRDYRIIPVTVNPIRINAATGEAKVLKSLHIEIEFNNEPSANQKTSRFDKSVSSFNQMYAGMISNLDWVNPNGVEVKGTLLLIHPNVNGVANILEPLIEWKTRRGYNVIVEQVVNNTTFDNIKHIIQTTYDSADPPLENVILVGDAAGTIDIPCGYEYYNGSSDHGYTLLEGEDPLPEIFIGRYTVDNLTTLQTVVNKILYYEKEPTLLETTWYKKGAVMAPSSADGLSQILVNQAIRSWWLEDGFTQVDTMWYNMGVSAVSFFNNTINGGITALNMRVYLGMSGISPTVIMNLNNPYRLPLMVMIGCATGSFGSSSCDESEACLRAGTPTQPKGGICGIGLATTSDDHRLSNSYGAGLWWGLHAENLTQLGPMTFRGKYELFITYQQDVSGLNNFTYWHNLMGDPSTDMWTAVPQELTITHSDEIPVGSTSFTITVEDNAGNPLADRYVCLWKGDETYLAGRTDDNGEFTAAIDAPTEGEMLVTVTYHNDYPYLGSVDVIDSPVYPSFYSLTVDDDNTGSSQGNNDGEANPSEALELQITLKNYGTTSLATAVNATLTSDDENVTVLQGTSSYPNINAGLTQVNNSAFVVELDSDFPHGYKIPFELTVNSTQGDFLSAFDLELVSADLMIQNMEFSSGLLTPGATDNYILTLKNAGGFDLQGVTVVLTTNDNQVTIENGTSSFGDISAGGTVSNSSDPFIISADNLATNGRIVNYTLTLTSTNGFAHELTSRFTLGVLSTVDPYGPDSYGYYCIDNTDVGYDQMPEYEWIEISSIGNQINLPDYGNEQDASARVDLPFDFTYYGETFDIITVCSNGWIGMGNQTYFVDFRNYPIPSALGPNGGMLCPFWDNLVLSGGGVYYYYDAGNNYFVIQYNASHQSGGTEVFEVILYDPAHYTTPTGDGEILFQYNIFTNVMGPGTDNDYSTVGIENIEHSDGLQYCYWNTYHPGAPVLGSYRSIKYTTSEPVKMPTSSDVTITLTPVGLPIIIPLHGGNFDYNLEAENVGILQSFFDVWTYATLPNGSEVGPLILRNDVGLTAGASIDRDLVQIVPPGAPEGDYTYTAYVGDYDLSEIWDEDSFEFSKSGTDLSGGGSWEIYGWDEDNLSAGQNDNIPERFAFNRPIPNPFNPTTELSYALPNAGYVKLVIFNSLGRQAAVLADGLMEAGWHQATFDAGSLASGLYFAQIQYAGEVHVQKLLLVK